MTSSLLHDVTKDPVSEDHHPCTHQDLDLQHIFWTGVSFAGSSVVAFSQALYLVSTYGTDT